MTPWVPSLPLTVGGQLDPLLMVLKLWPVSPGDLLGMYILCLSPQTNGIRNSASPGICALTGPPGKSDRGEHLRTAGPGARWLAGVENVGS